MYLMKKLLSAAAAATAILGMGGVAHAETTLTGNVAMATDYLFRGLSQTDGPAIQGGLDVAVDQFYVGTWGSNVNFNNNMELDIYGGFKPTVGPVALDIGAIGYLYPGADPSPTFNYAEIYGKGSITPMEGASIGAAVYYSPEFTLETGQAWYTEINASFTAAEALSISGAFGHQYIEDINSTGGGTPKADYNTWNIGGTYTYAGLGFDLRYIGTDIDTADTIMTSGFTNDDLSDDRVVFTLKKAL